MKERPILFGSKMVRAILDGRKTQTRRVLKEQPLEIIPMIVPDRWVGLMSRDPDRGMVFECRYGVPGDRLWVRETWAPMCRVADPNCECDEEAGKKNHYVEYRADTGNPLPGDWPEDCRGDECCPKWKPSIHMPRTASRITLEVLRIRVERVQEITEADVIAEGVGAYTLARGVLSDEPPDPRWKFIEIWNSINAKRGWGWDVNPWVWVVEFSKE